jgi:hypothetical protein
MSSNDARDALADIFAALRVVFKKYDRSTRHKAVRAMYASAGRHKIEQLMDSPTRPINGIPKLLNFKEWLSQKVTSNQNTE